MKKFSLILLILVSHNSCSFFNSVIENNEPAPALKESNQKIFCPQDGQTPKVSMASNNLNAKDIFTETLKNIPNGDKFTTIERGILFSLLHLNIRPDTFSPSARFQLFIKNKGSWEYWDVSSPKGQYPLLYGLETIALYYGSKYSLKKMAYFIDKYAPPYFPIGPQLGNFLVKNQKELSRHKIFNDAFFKAGQILQVGESIKKLPFRKIIKKYKALPKNEYQIKSKLFDFSLTNRNDLKIKCNLDLNLYSRSIYPIRNSSNTQTSPFGVEDTKGNAFIAVTSNRYKTLSPGLETFLISGNEKSLPVYFCQFK